MAEIRCPMCGKNNPAELDNCQFCGARLTPVGTGKDPLKPAAPETGAASAPGSGEKGNPGDWLSGLRDKSAENWNKNGEGAQSAENEGEESPDWLARLSANEGEETTGSKSGTPGSAEIFPENVGAGFQQRDSAPSTGESSGDWLHQMQDWSSGEASPDAEAAVPGSALTLPGPAAQDNADDTPDWLNQFKTWSEEEPAGGEIPMANEPVNNQPGVPASPFSTDEEDTSEWLKQFGDLNPSNEAPAAPSQEEAAAAAKKAADWVGVGEDDTGEWLKQFEGTQPAAVVPEAGEEAILPIPVSQGETPDQQETGAGERSPTSGDRSPTSGGEQLPGWLNQTPAGEAPSGGNEDMPPWLAEFNDEKPENAAAAEIPAWLAEASETQTPEPEPQASESGLKAPDTGTEMPDWLKGIREEGAQAAGTPAAPEAEAAVRDETPLEAATPQPEAGAAEAELPDWLAGFAQEGPVEAAAQPAPENTAPDAGPESGSTPPAALPDWLADFGQQAETGEEGIIPEETTGQANQAAQAAPVSPFADADLPDWLSGIGEESGQQETAPAPSAPAPIANAQTAATDAPAAETQLPVQVEAAVPTAAPAAEEAGPQPFAGVDLPDWLADFDHEESAAEESAPVAAASAAAESAPGEAGTSPFIPGELPDWLGDYKDTSTETEAGAELPAAEESAEPAGDNAAAAHLPGWLESMRPVEAVLPGAARAVEPGQVEKVGPLAGLHSLLSGEQVVLQYRKPAVPSSKLHVSERQRIHAELLDGMMAETTLPRPAGRPKSPAGQLFLRVLVSLALLVAVFIPLVFTPSNAVTIPPAASPAVQQLFNQLNSLPSNAPVLVAAEFDPGFYGEMRLVTSPVLRHLLVRNTRLALVSTNPAGPILAEKLLRDAAGDLDRSQANWGSYDMLKQTVNLGYLPGGLASLQELAADPQSATRYGWRIPLDKLLAWNYPALQGVNSLANFGAVIVLVDNADSGRAWLEQVQPSLGSVPLLLVSSAQAGPLLDPYYQSQQARGLLAGLGDAAVYEQISGLQPGHSGEWSAYQLGLAVAILIILVGSAFQAGSTLLSKQKKKKGE